MAGAGGALFETDPDTQLDGYHWRTTLAVNQLVAQNEAIIQILDPARQAAGLDAAATQAAASVARINQLEQGLKAAKVSGCPAGGSLLHHGEQRGG